MRSVPVVTGTGFFAASEPAIARGRMIGIYRASNITIPVAMFQGMLLLPRPAKPEPLLAAAYENS